MIRRLSSQTARRAVPVRVTHILVSGLSALLLSACTTLGPDYQEPRLDWLQDWQPDLYGQLIDRQTRDELDLGTWWHLFNDPVLNDLVEQLRRENLSLRIAGLRILESQAALGIADSNRYPQLQQIGGAIAYTNTQQHGGVASGADQGLTSYQAGFTLGWELDFWGRFRRGIESAEAAYLSSVTDQHDAQVLLNAQLADLYFAYRTTQLRIALADENAAIQKRSFDITEQLYSSGQQSELDLHQAKTQYLATLATIPGLQVTLNKTRNALCVLLGRPPGEIPELVEAPGPLPAVETQLISGIPARLLLRRPDVRSAAWQVAAQSAQIGLAEADLYPAISLLGSIGWSGNDSRATPDIATQSIGPGLQWNIFDYGRIRNNVRLQDARLQQLITRYQATALQAAGEIDDAAVSVVKSVEQQAILTQSVASARRALEIANTRYREGYSGFQRVLDAQRALFAQTERELVNQGAHISAAIALYKALGGGWMHISAADMIPADVRNTMRERSDWGDLLEQPVPVRVD